MRLGLALQSADLFDGLEQAETGRKIVSGQQDDGFAHAEVGDGDLDHVIRELWAAPRRCAVEVGHRVEKDPHARGDLFGRQGWRGISVLDRLHRPLGRCRAASNPEDQGPR